MKIKNVKIHLKKIIKNKNGKILKYISKKDKLVKNFGEVYFNYINKGKTKGWNIHKINKCFLICLHGEILVHLIDHRKLSKSFDQELKIKLNSINGKLLEIPPKVYFSLYAKKKNSIMCNFLEIPHKKSESLKVTKVKNYLIKN
tara:strand:- start:416 stop:847 length:432 start_codon:yes stop_codon:yes gene_type:complete